MAKLVVVEGFSEASLRFLRGLKRHNERDWFLERKAVFEGVVRAPMLRLIAEVNGAMEQWAPEHVRPPEKVVMRIYRDTRFSPDKRPYKTRTAAWWPRAGMEKISGAGFYVHVGGDEVMVGAGVWAPEREELLRLRQFLVERHEAVREALGSRKLQALGFVGITGQPPLTRPPKGFAEAPAEAQNLLRQREWGVSATFAPTMAIEAGFAGEVARRFRACAPLVALLNEPLLPRRAARQTAVAPLLF